MTAQKVLARNTAGRGEKEVQLASSDMSDGPFLGASSQAVDSALLQGHAAAYFQISGAYLMDAPSDGNTYGRKNAAWSVVTGGGISVTSPLTGDGTSGNPISASAYATRAHARMVSRRGRA